MYKSCLWVAEEVLKILENQEVLEKSQNCVIPSVHKKKRIVITVKNYAKTDAKVFCFCPILFDFFPLFQLFYSGLSTWMNFYL